VRAGLNPRLELEGVLVTMFDGRANLSQQVYSEIKKFFGSKLYETVIPRNIRLAEAPSHGLSVLAYDRHSSGAGAYLALGKEFLERRGELPPIPRAEPDLAMAGSGGPE
jgi:chromosome partitioning protein